MTREHLQLFAVYSLYKKKWIYDYKHQIWFKKNKDLLKDIKSKFKVDEEYIKKNISTKHFRKLINIDYITQLQNILKKD